MKKYAKTSKHPLDVIAGDFNTNPSQLSDHAFPEQKKLFFVDTELSEVEGTNSILNKVFDGTISNHPIVDLSCTQYTQLDNVILTAMNRKHVRVLGYTSRSIANKNEAIPFSDHLGFIFEVVDPDAAFYANKTKNECKKREHWDKMCDKISPHTPKKQKLL